MKFSESWLREWISPALSTADLVAQLTMAGLEVDSVATAGGLFSGVVVGEIVGIEPHPDAEKLRVCQVNGHTEGVQQVVCGAANARLGLKVPFATLGAVLPEITIKKAKLRGIESFGMLCGQTELQTGDDDSGLWELPEDAPVGADLREYLMLDDALIEVDLTPNRGDCLSIKGLARELGALNKLPVNRLLSAPDLIRKAASSQKVVIRAPEACPKYLGRVIRRVDNQRVTPAWMVEKLRRSGLASKTPLVDITNYVLLELGQPMHAFDLQKLQGAIEVRYAETDESLVLLNDQTLKLQPHSLIIGDQSGPIALAGIMGGKLTAVDCRTCDVFLEAAFFTPALLAGKARAYGLHTDSSHRFERGVDFNLAVEAMARATQLILEILGGEYEDVMDCTHETFMPKIAPIHLRKSRLLSGLGLDPNTLNAPELLGHLGLELLDSDADSWTFSVPSHRFDLKIEEDLLEEIGRVYGYDQLPTRALMGPVNLDWHSEKVTPGELAKQHLVTRGFQEVITYSFIDPKLHGMFFPEQNALSILNPISTDMSVMRPSLVPGLVKTLQYNLNRQQTCARLFEMGMVFKSDGEKELKQVIHLAGLIYGALTPASWSAKSAEPDFYDLKGDLESLLTNVAMGRRVDFVPSQALGYLHPGQTAQIALDGVHLGYIGALHPALQKGLDLPKCAYVFELDAQVLLQAELPKFKPLSKFPVVERDLALLLNQSITVDEVMSVIRQHTSDVLKGVNLFDVYQGEGIDVGKKSLAFNLQFQHFGKTLTDEEINDYLATILHKLNDQLGAQIR